MEHKSEAMMQTALANGWKAQVKPTIPESRRYDEIVWDLYCVRGQETIYVQWIGDRLTDATYTLGDMSRKPARAGSVIKLLVGKPDYKKLDHDEIDAVLQDRNVPWVHDTPAVEILLAVMHKEIKWIRKFDGLVLDAVVDVDTRSASSMKHFRVFESPPQSNRRVLEWADGFGFHAVALDQIIDVA
jgi:hypothetical protein